MSSGSAENTASVTSRKKPRPPAVRAVLRSQVSKVWRSSSSARGARHGSVAATWRAIRSRRYWACPMSARTSGFSLGIRPVY